MLQSVDTYIEEALADEILAEVARQRLTRVQAQALSGVKPWVWRRYLIRRDRSMPFATFAVLCDALGVSMSDMAARIEGRRAQIAARFSDADRADLVAMRAANRRAVERVMWENARGA